MAQGSIENRAGKYRARYWGPEGKQVRKTFDRKGDAQRWLNGQLAAMQRGDWVDPAAGKVTFGEYAAAWAAQQPHRPSTAAATASRLQTHLLPALGHRPLASIRPTELRALVGGLTKTLAPSTVEVVYRLAVTILRAAVEDGALAKSPCPPRMALPRPEGRQVEPMTVEQVLTLADAVPVRYRAAVIAAAGLGLRQGELFGLTVDRVDWLRRTVRIDRQLVCVTGQAPALGPTKTESSVRTIPAPTSVLEALTAHLQANGEGPMRLIFSTSRGTAVRRGLAADTWRTGANRADLPATTGWHELRHFYASLLIAAGESVKVVQSRLGHKSAMETLDTYGHLWPDSEEATRAAVDRVLAAPCTATLQAILGSQSPSGYAVGARSVGTPPAIGMSSIE